MFKKLVIAFLLLCTLSIVFSGCRSKYEKIRRSTDSALKLEKAKEYYAKKDYYRSLPLLEELVNIYRGTADAEQIYFYYAYCHYGLKDYLSARYHFKTFTETYPKSTYAEEASYVAAICYYKDSPVFSLAQQNTLKGIEALQLFINLYPKSERVAKCNELMDELRGKLEMKSYMNAKLYFNIGDYKSAFIAFKNSADDFPDSKYREEMDYLTIKAYYLYAKNSIDSKKEERFMSAIKSYQSFIEVYPNSKFLKDAESIYDASLVQLDHIKKLSINTKSTL